MADDEFPRCWHQAASSRTSRALCSTSWRSRFDQEIRNWRYEQWPTTYMFNKLGTCLMQQSLPTDYESYTDHWRLYTKHTVILLAVLSFTITSVLHHVIDKDAWPFCIAKLMEHGYVGYFNLLIGVDLLIGCLLGEVDKHACCSYLQHTMSAW